MDLNRNSYRYYLHGDFHPVKGIDWTLPASAQWRGSLGITRDGNGNVFRPGEYIVRGIEPKPARAGNVNFCPSMRRPVLVVVHLNISGNETRSETPMPGGLHQ